MSPCAIRIQSSVPALGESWTESVCTDMKRTVVCPEPRKLSWLLSHQQEDCDAKASNELLGLIFSKDDTLDNIFPFSPPRRVSNPQIQDARFINPVSPQPISIAHTRAPNPTVRIDGFHSLDINSQSYRGAPAPFVDNKFTPVSPQAISISHTRAPNPVVRIEGFHCLNIGNRSSCSIPSLA